MDSKRGGLPESSDTSGHVSAVRSSETVRRPAVAGRSSRSYGVSNLSKKKKYSVIPSNAFALTLILTCPLKALWNPLT